MSLIGGYRASGVLADTSVSSSAGIINFTGFKPSGLSWGNILGVGLYVWSGSGGGRSYSDGTWIPLKREWL